MVLYVVCICCSIDMMLQINRTAHDLSDHMLNIWLERSYAFADEKWRTSAKAYDVLHMCIYFGCIKSLIQPKYTIHSLWLYCNDGWPSVSYPNIRNRWSPTICRIQKGVRHIVSIVSFENSWFLPNQLFSKLTAYIKANQRALWPHKRRS